MTERCSSCDTGIRLMCDQAFATYADQMNDMAIRYDDDALRLPGRTDEVLDFVAHAQESSFKMLKHILQGPRGFDCGLTEEQITARLEETKEFRKVAE